MHVNKKFNPSRDPDCEKRLSFFSSQGGKWLPSWGLEIGNLFLQCSPFYVSTRWNSRQRWVSLRKSLEFSENRLLDVIKRMPLSAVFVVGSTCLRSKDEEIVFVIRRLFLNFIFLRLFTSILSILHSIVKSTKRFSRSMSCFLFLFFNYALSVHKIKFEPLVY